MFITSDNLGGSWQAFERAVFRYLIYAGFSGARLVGQSHDKGADVIASKAGKRWLFQVKRWRQKVGIADVDKTIQALPIYRAQVPAIVAMSGFEGEVYTHQRSLLARGIPLQLLSGADLISRCSQFRDEYPPGPHHEPRDYQSKAIRLVVQTYLEGFRQNALVVMATGLGKTFVAADAVRRIGENNPIRILAIAHTNALVYQLERAFWPFLRASRETLVWNGLEPQAFEQLARPSCVFACLDTVADYVQRGKDLPHFDLLLIDECHHAGAQMYKQIIAQTLAGSEAGPFLLGLTATPWRADEFNIEDYFGSPLVSVDLVYGLKTGFLANVDYRMYTDNVDWRRLAKLKGSCFSPRAINRTLFIKEWDDAVVLELQKVWHEQSNPRAIVFCGTIDHAITTRDRINALGFCSSAAIYSQTGAGSTMPGSERNRILSDFADGVIDVICAVDIFNEGIDVPDVNIIVFQRVTHSRRIFVQQLGRGLRLSGNKKKVTVLDFVSDIRRFAAGLNLKSQLYGDDGPAPGRAVTVRLNNAVTFRRVNGEDPQSESFLKQWLEDVALIEAAGEDSSVLKFPPQMPGGHL